MDAAHERCVKKAVIYSDLKNGSGGLSFGSVFFGHLKKMNTDRAESKDRILLYASTSADEL